jgi:glutamate racemase
MRKKTIAVLDSGVGGLSVLRKLEKNLSDTDFIYFGDNLNAPYGNKGLNQVWSLTLNNVSYIKTFNVDALVLGCNTLSVNFMNRIQDFFGAKTIGTFPPVEKCLIQDENTILLSTVSTAKKYIPSNNLWVLGLPNLAKDVESNLYSLSSIDLSSHFSNLTYCKTGLDNVILGCTHYEFIKNKIFNHFQPKKIISGVDIAVENAKKYFQTSKSLEKQRQNEIIFVGKASDINKNFYEKVVKKIL